MKKVIIVLFLVFSLIHPQAFAVSKPTSKISYKIVMSKEPIILMVIDPKKVNKNDMHTLGKQLRGTYKSKNFIRVSIYTSKSAADLWDKVLDDNLTPAEETLYDKNYVGQYNKNKNSGLNTFAIYYGGLNGKQEIIKY